MSKQVQIDEELFFELLGYFLQEPDEYAYDRIGDALSEKLDKMIARALFTEYKRSSTPQEREAARQKYLDHVGISKKFRSETECHT